MVTSGQYKQEILLSMREQGIKRTEKNLKKVSKEINHMNNEASGASREVRGNMLSMGMSFLFGGMALQRFAGNMLKSLMNTYNTIMGEGTKFNEQTNKLKGAFEFLKFSIFDALGQSELFENLVNWLVNAANAFSEFVQNHPILGKIIIGFLVLAYVIGTLLMQFGQFILFFGLGLGGMANLWGPFTLWMGAKWKALTVWMSTTWGKFNTFMAGTRGLQVLAVLFEILLAYISKNIADASGSWKNVWMVLIAGLLQAFFGLGYGVATVMDKISGTIHNLIKKVTDAFDSLPTWMRLMVSGTTQKINMGAYIPAIPEGEGFTDWVTKNVNEQMVQIFGQEAVDNMISSVGQAIETEGGIASLMGGALIGEGGFSPPDFEGGEGFIPEAMQSVYSPTLNFDLEVEGLSPEAQQNITTAVIAQLEEEGFLTGGAPQS